LAEPVPGAREKSEDLLFRRSVARQQAIAVQVDVTAKERVLWLEELFRCCQCVEPAADLLKFAPSSSQHPRQSIAARLASDLLGVTQQTPQRVLASAILVTGDGARTHPLPVPGEARGLARPKAGQQLVDAKDGQRCHVHAQKAFAAEPQHLDDGTAVSAKDRFSRRCPRGPAEAL